jgi:hypothetical protein
MANTPINPLIHHPARMMAENKKIPAYPNINVVIRSFNMPTFSTK